MFFCFRVHYQQETSAHYCFAFTTNTKPDETFERCGNLNSRTVNAVLICSKGQTAQTLVQIVNRKMNRTISVFTSLNVSFILLRKVLYMWFMNFLGTARINRVTY